MEHGATARGLGVLAPALWMAIAASPAAAQESEVLVGSYAYGWMGADLGFACGMPDPAVLTRVRLGSAQFEADGRVFVWFEERVTCPGGAFEDWSTAFDATYVLGQDGQLVVDLNPLQPGTTTCSFQMSWDRAIGTLTFDQESGGGQPAIGVLLRKGVGLDATALLGDHSLARMRVSQVEGGIQMRGSFGALSFFPGNQFTYVVDSRTIGPSGSTLDTGVTYTGAYTLDPDGTLLLDGGLHVGAVTQDGSFGMLVRRAAFGSIFTVFARNPTVEPTLWALDDLWWLALYGGQLDQATLSQLLPNAEVGVLSFDARTGRVLVGHTEAWADATGGGARNGFSFFPFAPKGMGAYELGAPPEEAAPLRLGRAEDVLLFAELGSSEDVWIGFAPRSWGALAGDVREVDVAAGGVQTLSVRAGAACAGRPYLILGSLAGTYPGTTFAGTHLALNPDRYLNLTLSNPDPPLSGSSGTLDALGGATAAFEPTPRWIGLVGSTVYHACVVFEGEAHQAVVLSSNAVPVLLTN